MPYERHTKLNYENLDEFLCVTDSLLFSLFSDSRYSIREKSFYEFICPNSVENFISGEIFSDGMIKIFPQAELATGTKIFCMLSLSYFLHSRFNYKLRRGNPDFYTFKAFDLYLYDILRYWAWDNCPQWEKRDKELCGKEHFFENFLKLSFCFLDSFGMEHVWRGSQYSSDDGHQFEVKSGFNYGAYMRFLLTENGNPIHCNFRKSTRGFWDWLVTDDTKAVKLPRGNTPYRLEDGCTADIDLLVFTLCLGLDEKIFNRLRSLRAEAYPNRTQIKPDIPNFFNETEEKAVKIHLREMLKDSKERLARIRKKEQVPKRIPKRILDELNEDLKKSKLKPLFT